MSPVHYDHCKLTFLLPLTLGATLLALPFAQVQAQQAPNPGIITSDAPAIYHFYRGNTHAHTSYTVSHGDQVKNNDPSRNGPPKEHHQRAKAAGYDFYATTDHSQEVPFD